MTPEELELLKQALHSLKAAGGSDPSFVLVGSLLIIVAVLSFRLFVVNGVLRKIFDYQKERNDLLTKILSELSIIKVDNQEENRKLNNVLQLVGDRREKS